MWIATLVGKKVFQNNAIVGVAKEDAEYLKLYVEHKYNLQFEKDYRFTTFGYRVYNNISDVRDIKLIIESFEPID